VVAFSSLASLPQCLLEWARNDSAYIGRGWRDIRPLISVLALRLAAGKSRAVHRFVAILKPSPFQPINIKDGVTDTHAKV
jgi:hypothetical protein